MPNLLEKKGRSERLREIVQSIGRGEKMTAFDLAVRFDVSIGVVYRDIRYLRGEKLIPEDFGFVRSER